jgi:hypothetical protein
MNSTGLAGSIKGNTVLASLAVAAQLGTPANSKLLVYHLHSSIRHHSNHTWASRASILVYTIFFNYFRQILLHVTRSPNKTNHTGKAQTT